MLKILLYFLNCSLFLLACQCKTPSIASEPTKVAPPTQTPHQSKRLSQAQADSLPAFEGKPLPVSLARAIFGENVPDTSALHLLNGPLDADPEQEMVCWIEYSHDGKAVVLDRQNDQWQISEPVYLDFWHGEHQPRLDGKSRALKIYHYGWGSSYRSEMLGLYSVVDGTLVEVFRLLEWEGSDLNGFCGAQKSIRGTYRFKSRNLILASYVYTVKESTDDGWGKGRTIFQSRIEIPFHWSVDTLAYVPNIPKGFPEENPDLNDGEFSFDPYFEPTLYEIRAHGPKWKRLALCSQEDDQ